MRPRAIRNLLPLVSLAGAAAALPAAFGAYGYYLGASLLVWSIFALAYDIGYGRTGLLSFGHAMFFGIGGYALALSVVKLDCGFWAALLISLAVSAIFTAFVAVFALRVRGHSFVIITIIFAAVMELSAYSWADVTGGEDGISFSLNHLSLGGLSLSLVDSTTKYYVFLAAALTVFASLSWLAASPLGRVFGAIRENERRALVLGYHVDAYKFLAFTISGALSGLSGALYALMNFHVSAELFGITTSMNPITAVLVGGAGTMFGPVVGAALVVLITDVLRSYITYAEMVLGVILILVVLFAPRGIVGFAEACRQMVVRRRQSLNRYAVTTQSVADERHR